MKKHDNTQSNFRVMNREEVKETWDNETNSSWSQLTQVDAMPDIDRVISRVGVLTMNLEGNCGDGAAAAERISCGSGGGERLSPPAQIHIPCMENMPSSGSEEEDDLCFSTSSHVGGSEDEMGGRWDLGLSACNLWQRFSPPRFPPKILVKHYENLPSIIPLRRRDRRASGQQQQEKQQQSSRTKGRRRSSLIDSKPTRFFSIAILLWILEMVLLITLKRVGVLEPEFRLNEAVAHHVLPSGVWNDTRWVPVSAMLQSLRTWGNESISKSLTYLTQEKKRPGFQLAQQGARAKYPLLIVPGFVTSGLEVWGGKECARKHFRQRMWAAMVGARSFFADRDCWRQHMMLDPWTGGDPEDIRLRAASGFEAVDYFVANYWVFGKMIENLADVGYTPSEMTVEPYDWRLATPMLEKRDGYFTRVKSRIEAMHRSSGKKVVITSHSMGVLVVHYFFGWVTAPEHRGGGGGGANWVDQHIHAFVNLAGTHLGVPKALSSLLSGEMSDTVLMNPMAMAVEQFFGRKLRQELWSTWGSIWSMFPKGGDSIWGVGVDICNATTAEKDPLCLTTPEGDTKAQLIAITDSLETIDEIVGHEEKGRANSLLTHRRNNLLLHHHNHTKHVVDNITGVSPILRHLMARRDFSVRTMIDYVKANGGGFGPKLANSHMYSLYADSPSDPFANRHLEQAWHDPTQSPLPHAPNMRVFCLYGIGRPTERAYYYKLNRPEQPQQQQQAQSQAQRANAADDSCQVNTTLLEPSLILDSDVSKSEEKVVWGVKYTNGDGSVPLLSLGYLCADAYTRPSSGLNPSNMAVYTREYPHQPEFTVEDPMRSGPKSADHVDLLGNVDMITDLLRILTDFEVEKVNENQISSEILEVSREINAKGGIFKDGKARRG